MTKSTIALTAVSGGISGSRKGADLLAKDGRTQVKPKQRSAGVVRAITLISVGLHLVPFLT